MEVTKFDWKKFVGKQAYLTRKLEHLPAGTILTIVGGNNWTRYFSCKLENYSRRQHDCWGDCERGYGWHVPMDMVKFAEISKRKCAYCGEEFDNDLTLVVNKYVCVDCLHEKYSICDNCGKYVEDTYSINNGEQHWCKSCTTQPDNDTPACFCIDCGKYHTLDRSVYIMFNNYVCQDCADSGPYYQCEKCGHYYHLDDIKNHYCLEGGIRGII